MFSAQPAAGIIAYLLKTHNPRAIIVTGSYADGTYSETSDFDCWLIGRDENLARHDTSTVNGVELQAEIYPLHYFMNMPMRRIVFFIDAAIAYDSDGSAREFMDHAQFQLRHDPCMPPEIKGQRMAYLEKMLRRAEKQDFHGDLRGHLLLFQTMESWCDFSDRVYPGAKKTLRLMERVDPESAAICRRALRTFDIGDMRAWVSRLRGVYEAGGGREYRVL